MARSSILSDEMLRQLVAVGQVDILVGVPTFNHSATIASVVKTLHVGLARHFPRERTVLVNPDAGSDDGTPDLVRTAPMADEEMRGSTSLRTTHRVSASYPGLPGRATGVRCVFAAADLLQARAVVLIDPEVTSMTPDWVAALARPVWQGAAELVLPIHPRHRHEGPLLGQLVRPLLGAAFGRRLHANLTGDFACDGRLATRLVPNGVWELDLMRPGFDVWLAATALAEDLRLSQVHLGPSLLSGRSARTGLPELFAGVVGTALECLDRLGPVWTARDGPQEVPVLGEPREPGGPEPEVELGPMAERFRVGVRDLAPVLREILTAGTLTRLQAAGAEPDPPRIPDPLWVTTVYEFAASAHRGVMNREHLTQALVPLYLGRVASFLAETDSADAASISQRMTSLEQEYETLRPYLLERWKDDGRR